MSAPLRVVFMGTPEFAVPSLRALASRPDIVTIIAVYTQPDRPAGRGLKLTKPPVKIVAEELGIPIHQPVNINDPSEKRKLADLLADLIVVAAYAQFLSEAVLNIPRLGCVNVHSSLLPKFRGAAPIQYAIWKGEKETGITTMRLVKKMDAGPILLQKAISIPADMTAAELHDRLAGLGGETIVETLEQIRANRHLEKAQEETQATYAPLLKKEDGLVNWERSGREIINQIRAFDPWPGTFGRSTRGLIKIHRARFHEHSVGLPGDAQPGDTFTEAGGLWVKCANGWIELLKVQPEGRKPMEIQEFMNGIHGAALRFGQEAGLGLETKK